MRQITTSQLVSDITSLKKELVKCQEENARLKEELSNKAETNASLTVLISEEKEKINKLKEALKESFQAGRIWGETYSSWFVPSQTEHEEKFNDFMKSLNS